MVPGQPCFYSGAVSFGRAEMLVLPTFWKGFMGPFFFGRMNCTNPHNRKLFSCYMHISHMHLKCILNAYGKYAYENMHILKCIFLISRPKGLHFQTFCYKLRAVGIGPRARTGIHGNPYKNHSFRKPARGVGIPTVRIFR